MSIFDSDNTIITGANKSSIRDFVKNHIFGFEKGPWYRDKYWPGIRNLYKYYYVIKLKPNMFDDWKEYIFYSGNIYTIPSLVCWVDDGKLCVNCNHNRCLDGRKFIIQDYNGKDIDWIDLDDVITAADIITVNCPNLKQYKGEPIILNINKEDIETENEYIQLPRDNFRC